MEIIKIIATIVIGGVGLFFLASGFQGTGFNWFDQWCGQFCIHPEWIAIGGVLVAVAFFACKAPWPPQSK